MYYFTRQREGEGGAEMKAFHGAEYSYIYDTHDSYMPVTQDDRQLTRFMQAYWLAFARTGSVANDEAPDWPVFEPATQQVQELGDRVRTINAPEPELCSLYDQSVFGDG